MTEEVAQLESLPRPRLTSASRQALQDYHSIQTAIAWGLPVSFEQDPAAAAEGAALSELRREPAGPALGDAELDHRIHL